MFQWLKDLFAKKPAPEPPAPLQGSDVRATAPSVQRLDATDIEDGVRRSLIMRASDEARKRFDRGRYNPAPPPAGEEHGEIVKFLSKYRLNEFMDMEAHELESLTDEQMIPLDYDNLGSDRDLGKVDGKFKHPAMLELFALERDSGYASRLLRGPITRKIRGWNFTANYGVIIYTEKYK